MTPDWDQIREDYARGETLAALERKYAVSRSTLRGRQRREGWQRQREQTETVQNNELTQSRMDRVAALADDLLGCLERAVEELDTVTESVREKAKKEDGGEVTTDYQRLLPQEQGIIDRGAEGFEGGAGAPVRRGHPGAGGPDRQASAGPEPGDGKVLYRIIRRSVSGLCRVKI